MTSVFCGRSRVVGSAAAALLLVGATASADTAGTHGARDCVAHVDGGGWGGAIGVSDSTVASVRITGLPDACAGLPASLRLYGNRAGDSSPAARTVTLYDSTRSCPAARTARVIGAQLDWPGCGSRGGVGVSAHDVTALALTFTSPGESATTVLGEKRTRRPASSLPFTGFPALWLAVLAVGALVAGWVGAKRRRPTGRPAAASRPFQQH